MKKYVVILILLLAMGPGFSQDYPAGTATIKKLVATELQNGDTIKHRVMYTYYDSLNNKLEDENTIASALKPGTKTVTVLDSPEQYIKVNIQPNGDTLDVLIYRYDAQGNRTHYFQVRQGDTLSANKRVYDAQGNNTELYYRDKETGAYYLRTEWEYDDHNNTTHAKTYNATNTLIRVEKYKNVYKKDKVAITKYAYKNGAGFVKKFTATRKGDTEKTQYYFTARALNYGITLDIATGGYMLETYDAQDRMQHMELYDDRKKLVAQVDVTWQTVP